MMEREDPIHEAINRATPDPEPVPHENAWRIPTADGTDYGVLVLCGSDPHPYWWLLCPGTATLYFEDSMLHCNNGDECNFLEDVHRDAEELRRRLIAEATQRGSTT